MLRTRVMPALLIDGSGLVKTIKFDKPAYIGDASNSCRIFNQMEVDELILFDIGASSQVKKIQFDLIQQVVSECFMPICYGGGVKTLEDFQKLFYMGVEKVSVSSLIFENPDIIKKAINIYGAQSIIATLDIKKSPFKKKYRAVILNSKKVIKKSLDETLSLITDIGFGELIINNVNRDGTWEGFDCDLMTFFTSKIQIPVVALGGAGKLEDIKKVVNLGGASAIALGSMSVFQKKGMGVLISFPKIKELESLLGE